jgi:hypothetical protein
LIFCSQLADLAALLAEIEAIPQSRRDDNVGALFIIMHLNVVADKPNHNAPHSKNPFLVNFLPFFFKTQIFYVIKISVN